MRSLSQNPYWKINIYYINIPHHKGEINLFKVEITPEIPPINIAYSYYHDDTPASKWIFMEGEIPKTSYQTVFINKIPISISTFNLLPSETAYFRNQVDFHEEMNNCKINDPSIQIVLLIPHIAITHGGMFKKYIDGKGDFNIYKFDHGDRIFANKNKNSNYDGILIHSINELYISDGYYSSGCQILVVRDSLKFRVSKPSDEKIILQSYHTVDFTPPKTYGLFNTHILPSNINDETLSEEKLFCDLVNRIMTMFDTPSINTEYSKNTGYLTSSLKR
jgi:hypothetical protein